MGSNFAASFDVVYVYQSEGLTERINEPPWGRCPQGVVHAQWVVVVVVDCCLLLLLFVVVFAPQGVILD